MQHSCDGVGNLSLTFDSQYIPAAGESVLGTIFQRAGEGYRLDIGAAHPASLDGYAFEGASKKNKPRLEVSNCTKPLWMSGWGHHVL